MTSGGALELIDEFRTSLITSKGIQGVVPRGSGGGNRRSSAYGVNLRFCGSCGHGHGETMTSIESNILKRPTLTKSTSSSSRDNRGNQIAPRDDGKSPRGQD